MMIRRVLLAGILLLGLYQVLSDRTALTANAASVTFPEDDQKSTPTPETDRTAAIMTAAASLDLVIGGGASDQTDAAATSATSDGSALDSDDACVQLQTYDATWQEAVAELEACGYIGTGGSLIRLPEDSNRDGYINLSLDVKVNGHHDFNWGGETVGTDHPDVVMAGLIHLHVKKTTSPDDRCGLTVRARGTEPGDISGGYLQTFLEVDLTADGQVYYRESSKGEETDELYDEHLDMKQNHHILMIAIDNRLTFFIDGKLIAKDLPVENRRGTYRAGMYSQDTRAAKCDVSQTWVYAAPTHESGICQVASAGMINRRKKPGTSSKKLGSLYQGDFPEVVARTEGDDGHVWYQLDDRSWVRDDIVTLLGECEEIPEQ